MVKYVVSRVVAMALSLFFIISITFFLMHSIPGGPFTRERRPDPRVEAAMMKKYNLDKPLGEQFVLYLGDLLQGDFGPSYQYPNRQVGDMIFSGFTYTAKIGFAAIVVSLLLGIPLGILAALRQNRVSDVSIMFTTTLGVTIPNFVMAILLIYVFSVWLGWFPVVSSSLENLRSMVLPVVSLSAFSLSFITRLMRSAMLDVIHQDYIRTARAKGMSESKVILKHALKNAILPIITYVGPMVANLLTGSFVIEKMFTIPGMGGFFVNSISNRDYTMIMGATIFYAALLIGMTLVVDLAYGLIDPRIDLSSEKGAV